jgi:hypothetical protein
LKLDTQHRQCPRKCTQTLPEIVLLPHAASLNVSTNLRPPLKSRWPVMHDTFPVPAVPMWKGV